MITDRIDNGDFLFIKTNILKYIQFARHVLQNI